MDNNRLLREENDELSLNEKQIKRDSIKTKPLNRIVFYEKENGSCPVAEMLNSIKDVKLKSKILKNIERLDEEGSKANQPLSKYVEDGILELRTQVSNNLDRIFYFFVFGDKIIMTNGYVKKTQKLDRDELNKAKQYRDNYMKLYYSKGGNK